MEPRPSYAEFTVLPRAVPASSLWAPEPGTVHNALIRSVTTANIHGGRVNDLQRRAGEGGSPALGSPSPGHRQRAGETRRCPTAEPSR